MLYLLYFLMYAVVHIHVDVVQTMTFYHFLCDHGSICGSLIPVLADIYSLYSNSDDVALYS